ncbi:MAG TPA: pseudouridine synthase [Gemmatimonadota bacterium]|jgi:pseudouridine synthase
MRTARATAERRGTRLQKVLAQAGVASRRKGEDLIRAGKVTVNGRVVTELGTRVDPARDRIAVGETRLDPAGGPPRHLLLFKPRGAITTRADPRGRKTVYDCLPADARSLVYVGRLDRDAEGLLLFTSDGELAHRLTHPRYRVPREYLAQVEGTLDEARLLRGARRGLELEDGLTAPFQVARAGGAWRIVLREGRTHEVKRIFEAVGGTVVRLRRTRVGEVTLRGLRPGRSRPLTARELRALRRATGLEG